MRRLASLAAIIAVAASPSARAEQLDIDLTLLGPPTASAWAAVAGPGANTTQLAHDSRHRFAILSTEMALALSSALLQPAATTGHSGFAIDLEVASATVHPDPVGVTTGGYKASPWPTRTAPDQLLMPSFHVRKGLPFSFELGGRFIYLAQSNYFAAQGEGKWALNEGLVNWPDVAVRAAYTRLFGVKDWNLATFDLDLLVSKRFAMSGVVSLTPYLAGRYTYVSSYSEQMDFGPPPAPPSTTTPYDPAGLVASQAAFPRFNAGFYRTTLGLRFGASSFSLALEGTYFGGATKSSGEYDSVKIASTFGGAAKLGWAF